MAARTTPHGTLRFTAAIGLLLAGGAAAQRADAADSPASADDRVAFRVESPAHIGCPGAAELEASVLARTKKARKAAASEDARVYHVEFQDEGGGLTGRLTVERDGQRSGVRTLRGSSCDDVGTALALTVALSIDPAARQAVEPPTLPVPSPRDAGVPCEAVAPPPPVLVVAPVVVPASRIQARLGLAAGLAQVVVPGVMTATSLTGEIALRSQDVLAPSVRVSAGIASSSLDVASNAGFTWVSAQVELCPIRAGLGWRVEVRPCGAVQGGWLHGSGQIAPDPLDASRAWWTAGGSAHVSALVSSDAGIELSGTVAASLHEWDFVFQTPTRLVARTASAPWTASLGAFFTLP